MQFNSAPPRRRDFLAGAAAALGLSSCTKTANTSETESGPADVTLRIAPVLVDIAKDHTISTVGYNGSVPGPLIRLHEGVPVTVDIFNELDYPELVHWHGQLIPADVDGASEEHSLVISANGHLRYKLTPQPSGSRWVHSHVMAGPDLSRGTYSGQFAFVYIEPKSNPGQYDQEFFLATHEWEPFFTSAEEEEDEDIGQPPPDLKTDEKPNGWEIGYQHFTINGKALGYGEPLRVKQGQRVQFHILNASATENIKLALSGHKFQIVALDGNPAPVRGMVDLLELGTGERIDAVVEMNNPGVWVLGTPKDDDRRDGMGIVVEYAGKTGAPRWIAPPKAARWDYTMFGEDRDSPAPDETIPMVFGKINGGTGNFNRWTINGKGYDEKDGPHALVKGRHYRLVFDNHTDDAHPVHLHRNIFELTNVHGKRTAGIRKDVVLVKGFRKIEVDFTPEQTGFTLFHCHQQLHMDFGFKMVFNVS